jgi:hypothetical protein
MANWSPPSVPRKWLVVATVLYVLLLAYSVLVLGRILLGVLPGLAFVSLSVLWRVLAAVEAIADAQQRLADQRERN